jgi:xanthine dehydrogenase YagT iron-sulfur-binding subunit
VEEIRAALAGNLCKCGAYAEIVAAIQDVTASGRSGS